MTREPLTLAQALAGHSPAPFSDAEWRTLHAASAGYHERVAEIQDADGRWVSIAPLMGSARP